MLSTLANEVVDRTQPEARVWQAVLLRSVLDILEGNGHADEARWFLDSDEFVPACCAAGFDPAQFRRGLEKALQRKAAGDPMLQSTGRGLRVALIGNRI